MASISIQTKKFADLTAITSAPDDAMLIIHDGSGVKKISAKNLKADVTALINTLTNNVNQIMFSGAGAHNSIYRGKSLGTSVTDAQWSAIKDGTFTDLYIGDYWTISNVVYRIAAFDYYLNQGDVNTTAHHVVVVPDTCLYNAVMNSTNTTAGAYLGSAMYKTGLTNAKTTIKAAFPSHILSHKIYLNNTVANGKPTAGAWTASEVDLMNQQMVYGNNVSMPVSDGTTVPDVYRTDKTQLPLFVFEPSRIGNRQNWWLRDVITSAFFATVGSSGGTNSSNAGDSLGVRPAFCIA